MSRKTLASLLPITALVLLASSRAWASSAGMPWEGPLQRLVSSLTGPVAKAVGVISIVGCGFGLAFSEGGSGMRKALILAVILSATFAAVTWALPFLGFSGGLSV
jgi:type IV secretion system protein VirB2